MTAQSFCPKCGSLSDRNADFCPICGCPTKAVNSGAATAPRPKPAVSGAGTTHSSEIAWELNIPLVTNRFILYDMVKVLGISGLLVGLLFVGITVFSGHLEDVPYMFMLAGICLGIFAVAMLLAMVVFFGNRIPTRFVLTKRGAQIFNLSRRSKVGSRLAIVLGLLKGAEGLSTAGAGMLALSQERTQVNWCHVRRTRFHPSKNVISLMNSWRVVMRLYCTPENYDRIVQAVEQWTDRKRRRK